MKQSKMDHQPTPSKQQAASSAKLSRGDDWTDAERERWQRLLQQSRVRAARFYAKNRERVRQQKRERYRMKAADGRRSRLAVTSNNTT